MPGSVASANVKVLDVTLRVTNVPLYPAGLIPVTVTGCPATSPWGVAVTIVAVPASQLAPVTDETATALPPVVWAPGFVGRLNVKEVAVVLVIVRVPLNPGGVTPAMSTLCPVTNPCGAAVVIVATPALQVALTMPSRELVLTAVTSATLS